MGLLSYDGRPDSGNAPQTTQSNSFWPDWSRPPGTFESLIPVWGSAREAIAEANAGNYVSAGINAALALSDLNVLSYATRGLAKGAIKASGSFRWSAPYTDVDAEKSVRQWMGEKGFLKPNQEGHHWLFKQKTKTPSWRDHVPDWIKNQPWNIMSMPNRQHHMRLHKDYILPEYSKFEKYMYGTPRWSKALTGSAAGHAGEGVYDLLADNDNE